VHVLIENVQVSKRAKEQLIKLKAWTGVQNWNVLCRWALCVSLGEKSVPPFERIVADSSVQMSWKVFAGPHQDLYIALVRERCRRDGLGTDDETVVTQFKLHLHRGIAYLAGDRRLREPGGFLNLVVRGPNQPVT
jgi:DNA sulfur modification protein DndE